MDDVTQSLVQHAVGGDRAAMRQLVRALRPVVQTKVAAELLRRRGFARGRDVRQETEDLVQEVFVSLFDDDGRALLRWDPARGSSLSGFVGLIASRRVVSILRSRNKSPWTEDPVDFGEQDASPSSQRGPELDAASKQMLAAVLGKLDEKLTERGRVLFRLLIVEGQPAAAVCEELSMTPEAVHAWKSRLCSAARAIAAELASGTAAPSEDPQGSKR